MHFALERAIYRVTTAFYEHLAGGEAAGGYAFPPAAAARLQRFLDFEES